MTFKVGDLVQRESGWPFLIHRVGEILPDGDLRLRYWDSKEGYAQFDGVRIAPEKMVPANEMLVIALASR